MPSLTLSDLTSRSTKPMAKKKNWIKGAIAHPGALKKKAAAAGESTKEFAATHAGDKGTTGKQARLAETLMGMRKKKNPLHDHERSQ